jgi:kynurenine formamidase
MRIITRELLGRRTFAGLTGSTGAVMLPGGYSVLAAGVSSRSNPSARSISAGAAAGRVVDLTHPLTTGFPTFGGEMQLELETVSTFAEDGYLSNRWRIHEHTGTHLDAPLHFAPEGLSVAEIAAESLIVPAIVVDIREKAQHDADARLTAADLRAFEAAHGLIPAGSAVLMDSGWDVRTADPATFRNADELGVMHFPGFHEDAAAMLLADRHVVGIGVDTLSLDYGPSIEFPVHRAWLPSNRWGLECLANLGQLPPVGATLFVGAPAVVGGTGAPSRVLALVP